VIASHYVGVCRHKDRHQIVCFMTILIRLCQQLTGHRVLPSRVKLTHQRNNDSSEFVEFLGGNVDFGELVDEVTFAPAIRQMPVVSADPYLNKFLISYFEEMLSARPKSRGSFQSSVENAIVPILPHGKAHISEIARRLGISQRSLARRLALEGQTFSNVLEGLRSNLAESYLTDEDLSISQIAWLLGYKEVSALTHAFKRWTGTTPRQARHSPRPEGRVSSSMSIRNRQRRTGYSWTYVFPAPAGEVTQTGLHQIMRDTRRQSVPIPRSRSRSRYRSRSLSLARSGSARGARDASGAARDTAQVLCPNAPCN
jgi:AraC-like DNA-binding protein